MKIFRVIFAMLIVNFLIGSAFPQKQKDNTDEQLLTIKANLLVADASGQLVNDLKPEDVRIFEDGIEQKITYFSKKEPVTNVGFVIDNTGSMRRQIDGIKEIAGKIVNNLGNQDEAFIVRFVDTEKTSILEDWTSDKALLNKSITNMFIEGGQSALIDAINLGWLKISKREENNRTQKYALVLISDCEDRSSVSNISQILFQMKNADVEIYIVALTNDLDTEKTAGISAKSGSVIIIDSANDKKKQKKTESEKVKIKDGSPREKAESFAKNLAFQTGGRVFILDKRNQPTIDDVVKNLRDEFRSQYIVKYVSTNQDRKNTGRKLTVQIADGENGGKRLATIRENVSVPQN